ncbi:MAG: hypothetical protein LBL96_02510 [Clostridiales bacterium]|nr:hypothetical protein [Clostridiales bacterium]
MDYQKRRYQQYLELIEDVALEISQSSYWRHLLFNSEYNQKLVIDSSVEVVIFKYIKEEFVRHDLKFYVSKVEDCPDEFDPGSIIFKFESVEFPEIVRYSGN